MCSKAKDVFNQQAFDMLSGFARHLNERLASPGNIYCCMTFLLLLLSLSKVRIWRLGGVRIDTFSFSVEIFHDSN